MYLPSVLTASYVYTTMQIKTNKQIIFIPIQPDHLSSNYKFQTIINSAELPASSYMCLLFSNKSFKASKNSLWYLSMSSSEGFSTLGVWIGFPTIRIEEKTNTIKAHETKNSHTLTRNLTNHPNFNKHVFMWKSAKTNIIGLVSLKLQLKKHKITRKMDNFASYS